MTTFTSDDREEEYKKIVSAAPYQPGYEDAVPIPFAGWVNTAPPHIVDSGASVMGMTALELANLLDFDAKTLNWKLFSDAATMLRQQQAEIEALRMGFANIGTSDSDLAETRAMANRIYLQKQELEHEKKDMNEKYQQQQAEISLLQEYVCQLEEGLDSSINLNKAQAERNNET